MARPIRVFPLSPRPSAQPFEASAGACLFFRPMRAATVRGSRGLRLPDLSEVFCQEIPCFADIPLTEAQFSSMKRWAGKRQARGLVATVEYKGQRAWNHLTFELKKISLEKARLTLFIHTYSPPETEKESRSGKLSQLLTDLDSSCGEASLRVSAVFRFPAERFTPVIVFPDKVGLQVPLPDLQIRITGLSLHVDGGPVDTLFVDVSSPDTIYVGMSWALTSKIGLTLPRQCLAVAEAMAKRVVAESNRSRETPAPPA